MGTKGWLRDCVAMTARTKPQYISSLGRKRSSVHSPLRAPDEEWGWKWKCWSSGAVMCCSVSCGVVLLLRGDSTLEVETLLLPLVVAAMVALFGGVSVSEYMSSQPQEVPSIYSCSYQYSSEMLAFFVGWVWILSQAALIAALCRTSSVCLQSIVDLQPVIELSQYAEALPPLTFLFVLSLLLLTGLSETSFWHVVAMPIVFVLVTAAIVASRMCLMEQPAGFSETWMQVHGVKQVLADSSLCCLFFSGPQSLLRISTKSVRQQTSATLGPLNSICFALILILLISNFGKVLDSSSDLISVTKNVLFLISLCMLGMEAFHPLYFVIEDMSSDGLLFRTLSRKCKPFCFPVPSCCVQLLSLTGIGLLVTFVPTMRLLTLSVVFPLTINTVIPILVLLQRYRDTTAWQYEPMLQTAARSLPRTSRKAQQESQYSNNLQQGCQEDLREVSTACVESGEESSDTDIDSIVQQYRDQARIANMAVKEELGPEDQVPEPTPTSTFRALLCIGCLLSASLTHAFSAAFAETHPGPTPVWVCLCSIAAATAFQCLLMCLPQNKGANPGMCCPRAPPLPWIPGMASLVATTLLVHCVRGTWRLCLGWFIAGLLLYFSYGIRSSTAANSFYHIRPAHLALRPLPSYGNNCVPQVLPSQRKRRFPRIAKIKTSIA